VVSLVRCLWPSRLSGAGVSSVSFSGAESEWTSYSRAWSTGWLSALSSRSSPTSSKGGKDEAVYEGDVGHRRGSRDPGAVRASGVRSGRHSGRVRGGGFGSHAQGHAGCGRARRAAVCGGRSGDYDWVAHGSQVRARLARLTVTGAVLGAIVLGVAPVALAGEISPPPYAKCRFNVSSLSLDSAPNQKRWISCQYYDTSKAVTELILQGNGDPYGSTGSGTMYFFYSGSGGNETVEVNSGGKWRGYWTSTQAGKSFDPGATTSYGCSIKVTGGSSVTCELVYVGVTNAYPTYPTDWYAGGSDGNTSYSLASPSVSACSRALTTTAAGNQVATFYATAATVSHAVDTYSWVWGDGTTAGTVLTNTKHNYGDGSTQHQPSRSPQN